MKWDERKARAAKVQVYRPFRTHSTLLHEVTRIDSHLKIYVRGVRRKGVVGVMVACVVPYYAEIDLASSFRTG